MSKRGARPAIVAEDAERRQTFGSRGAERTPRCFGGCDRGLEVSAVTLRRGGLIGYDGRVGGRTRGCRLCAAIAADARRIDQIRDEAPAHVYGPHRTDDLAVGIETGEWQAEARGVEGALAIGIAATELREQ